jgi:hypothetical protein
MEINPEILERLGSWFKEVSAWAIAHQSDVVVIEDRKLIILVVSNIPQEEDRLAVIGMVPSDYSVEFKESVHGHTIQKLVDVCMSIMALPDPPSAEDHYVKINLNGMPLLKNVPNLWDILGQILESDEYVHHYDISLNGELMFTKSRDPYELKNKAVDPVEQVQETLKSIVTVEDFLKSGLFGGKS